MNKKSIGSLVISTVLIAGCAGEPRIQPVERDKMEVKNYSAQVADFNDIESNLNDILEDCDLETTVERNSEFSISVYFDSELGYNVQNDQVDSEIENYLKEISSDLKEYSNLEVYVNGHSDGSGLEKINYSLSKQRAKKAAQVMTNNGLKSYQVFYDEFASTQPKADNDYQAQREQNRRIDLTIQNIRVDIPDDLKGVVR